MPNLVLHHLEHSRSHRILWLLEELELPYELVTYQRDASFRAPEALRNVHPLGKSPVLTINGVAFAETGAVIEAVLDRFAEGRLRPPAGPDLDRFRYFLHYAEGSLMPPLLVRLITEKTRRAPFPIGWIGGLVASGIDRAYTSAELTNHGAWLERCLAEQPWFAGARFTAADIQMSYPVAALVERAGLDLPKCAAFLGRIQSRPAFVRAIEQGGPPF